MCNNRTKPCDLPGSTRTAARTRVVALRNTWTRWRPASFWLWWSMTRDPTTWRSLPRRASHVWAASTSAVLVSGEPFLHFGIHFTNGIPTAGSMIMTHYLHHLCFSPAIHGLYLPAAIFTLSGIRGRLSFKKATPRLLWKTTLSIKVKTGLDLWLSTRCEKDCWCPVVVSTGSKASSEAQSSFEFHSRYGEHFTITASSQWVQGKTGTRTLPYVSCTCLYFTIRLFQTVGSRWNFPKVLESHK